MVRKAIFFVVVIIFCSCSKDEEKKTAQSFFNLKIGNSWVYKKYHSDSDDVYHFTNKIDSVSIPGDTLIQGITYFKMLHEQTGHHFSQFYWRVDGNGHLVDNDGNVVHPGTDIGYYSSQLLNYGTLTYHLLEPTASNVEGVTYYVYTYFGDYEPFDSEMPKEDITSQFQQNLGMVKKHYSQNSNNSDDEIRLVACHLN